MTPGHEGLVVIPALPLSPLHGGVGGMSHIPRSPQSEGSVTTEQSRDTDGSFDRVSTALTQISINSTPVSARVWFSCVDGADVLCSFRGYRILRDSFRKAGDGIGNMLHG